MARARCRAPGSSCAGARIPANALSWAVSSSQRKGEDPMHQHQPRHLGSGPVLASVLVFAATVALAPRASHAQGQCPTRFQEQASGLVTDQGTVCQTAVSKKCVFEMALCV